MRLLIAIAGFVLLVSTSFAAERYAGPRPPKPDVPYLVHADNLLATEEGMASTETRKDATYALLNGTTSTARTPLAEPIFIIQTEKLQADKFEAYKLDVKNGKREVLINHKKPKNVARPVFLTVTRLDERLYRIEVDEPLENGEYTLTPQGSDATFSFTIY
jgi:hypothetical protein